MVYQNLRNSFPDKTEAEIDVIAKKFYKHLCDMFVEVFKTLTIAPKNMLKHCYFHPDAAAIFAKLADENKSAILVMGHMGNWEWGGNTFSLICRHQLYVIYHPLANKYFDGLIFKMRTRFGTRLITMKNTYKEMFAGKMNLNTTAFIADQTPQPGNAYWTTFLNQETGVFKGTETIAKKLNTPVVYGFIKKVRRGVYEINAELLTTDPASIPENGISEMYTRRLEKDIIEMPETWLWSHRRWKHKRPAEVVE